MKNTRNKIANFFKLGVLLLGVSLLFWSCESDQELLESPVSEKKEFTFKKVFSNTLQKNENLQPFLKKINNKKESTNLQLRGVYNKEYDITVETESASYIEQGDYHSYTFATLQTKTENIVNVLFSLNELGGYDSFLVEYDYSYKELETLSKETLSEKTKMTPINFDLSSLQEKNASYFICTYKYELRSYTGCIPGYGCGNLEGNTIWRWVVASSSCLVVNYEVSDSYNSNTSNTTITYTTGGVINTANGGVVSSGPITTPTGPSIYDEEEAYKLFVVKDQLNLNILEKDWVGKNAEEAFLIYDHLKMNMFSPEAKTFAQQAIEALMSDYIEDIAATNMTLNVVNSNLLNAPYNDNYFNTINQYVDADLTDPYLQSIWIAHFSAQCAILKAENPDWTDYRIYWEASKEMIHVALDIGGMVPVVGEVCDVTNGIIYTIEGDGVNAAFSFSAAIPIAGWAATGSKYAYKLTQHTINGTKVKLVLRILNDGSIYFGSSGSKLRKALGLTDATKHAHHLMPWAMREHELIQKAAKSKSAFHINEVLNGIPRPSSLHLTGHSIYNGKILAILDEYKDHINTTDEAFDFISGFANHIRDLIIANPNLNSGQIADLISYP